MIMKLKLNCALTAPTHIAVPHNFEPMAALMLKYLAMALPLWVPNPSIFNTGVMILSRYTVFSILICYECNVFVELKINRLLVSFFSVILN